jgi:hypothetical protein
LDADVENASNGFLAGQISSYRRQLDLCDRLLSLSMHKTARNAIEAYETDTLIGLAMAFDQYEASIEALIRAGSGPRVTERSIPRLS